MMPGISPETRVIFWIVAQIAGGVFAIMGSVLAINFIYFLVRTGRPPTQRSPLVWGIFLGSFVFSIVFGALANFAPTKFEYVGRVIDIVTQQPIAGAKVTLDLQDVPPIVFTDSEGVYRFKIVIKSDISGQVRVDGQGYQTYTRNISLSSRITTIEDIRLTPQSTVTPPESMTQTPSSDRIPEDSGQIFIVDVQPSSGYWVHPDSSECLWTEASGQGAYIVLTLEQESVIYTLRVALSEPFVTRVRLTFSDNSQQTVYLDEIKTYAYQEVMVEPVKTSSMKVEVLEVKNNSFSNFGICHIEVFGTRP